MSLVGFTLLGSIEAPTLTGAATGVPLLVKPNTEFTAAMLASLDVGGGDLRFSSDAAGLNQLPCEIVDGLDVVWVKPTGVSISTGATLYVWGDNTGARQPAVGAAFGRNAVWVDYESAWHFDTLDDSAGNATSLTTVGTPTTVTGAVGDAKRFASSSDYLYTDTVGVLAGDSFNTSFWYTRSVGDSLPLNAMSYGIADSSSAFDNYGIRLGRSFDTLFISVFDRTTSSSFVQIISIPLVQEGESVLVSINQSVTGTSGTAIHNGTTYTGTAAQRLQGAGFNRLSFNRLMDSSPAIGGLMTLDEPRLTSAGNTSTTDQISIEYDNQSTTGSWWVASDVAGGISITESVVNSNYVSLDPAILLTGSISVTESLVNTNYTALNPTVSFVGIISISESTVNTNYTALNPTIDFTGLVSVTESIVNSDYNSLSATITLTTGAVEIIESVAGTQYTASNPSILLTPEPLGIVSTVCFNGELVDLNYSGQSGILEFSGQLETAIFNGEFNALDFSGTIQTTCADGDIKTNC